MADNQEISRLKENEREFFERPKRKDNSGDIMKERNKRRKLQEKIPVSGNIKIYVPSDNEKTAFFNKLDKAKLCMDEKISSVSNYSVLTKVLDFFLDSNTTSNAEQSASETSTREQYKPYLYSDKDNTSEDMVLATQTALKNLVCGVQEHAHTCQSLLDVSDIMAFGHVGKLILTCSKGHTLRCDTSPHIEGGKFLANLRMIYGVNSSGLRYVQYERLCKATGIGLCSESMFSDVQNIICEVTEDAAKISMETALLMEIGQSVANSSDPSQTEGIDIITDARHGTRKNSAFSDVVALGGTTHKVVAVQTVSKKDDPCSQRHELYGVKNIYKSFESKNIKVRLHGHDRNPSVNKYLMKEHPEVKNANDTWHATKGITKVLKGITSGPKKNHGKTWHTELTDKAAAIKTATYHAMKSCDGSPEKLRQTLDNICDHYRGIHENCSSESRCKKEENYICSKSELKDPVAISLLTSAIKKLQVYKTPEDYVACVDTHYVESYNNSTLIYHDKRITFGEKEYKRRTHLSIIDWNENVDRDYTSVVLYEDVKNPRRRVGHKNLKPKSYNYYNVIWNKIMDKFYTSQ